MKNRGFTLIEVLLVVVIIGILAAIVVPRLVGSSKEAKISAAKLEMAQIRQALARYEMHTGSFPTTELGLQALLQQPANVKDWKGPYLEGKSVPLDPWGNEYRYVSPGTENPDYDLFSIGPDGTEGTEDDIDAFAEDATGEKK